MKHLWFPVFIVVYYGGVYGLGQLVNALGLRVLKYFNKQGKS